MFLSFNGFEASRGAAREYDQRNQNSQTKETLKTAKETKETRDHRSENPKNVEKNIPKPKKTKVSKLCFGIAL